MLVPFFVVGTCVAQLPGAVSGLTQSRRLRNFGPAPATAMRIGSWAQSAEPSVLVEPSRSEHVIGVEPQVFGSALLQTCRIGTVSSPRAISWSGSLPAFASSGCTRAEIAASASSSRPGSGQTP